MFSRGMTLKRPESIKELSLSQMVEARRMIQEADKFTTVCDDRFLAALYTTANYTSVQEPIAIYEDRVLCQILTSEMKEQK